MGKSYSLASITVTSANLNIPIMAATSLRINKGWIKITNETPYAVSASINEDSTTIPPQSIGGLKLDNTTSILYVTATSLIPQSAPSSVISFEIHPDEDLPDGLPIPLPRQTMPSAPTAQVGFVLTSVASPAAINQLVAYCIFNPSSSGKIYYFYRITAVQNGATTFAQCGWVSTDPNFAFARTPLPQTSRIPQPTTAAHCTLSNTTDVASNLLRLFEVGGNAQEFMGGQADVIEIVPGTGLLVEVTPIPATSTSVSLNSQWLEQ